MKTYRRSFSGGEIAPEMLGQIGDAKQQTGVAQLLNMIARPEGSATRRPGTRYVADAKFGAAKKCRLVPFRFNVSQNYAIEVGEGYFRFYQNCERVRLASTPPDFVLPQSFVETALDDSANEITTPLPHNLATGDIITLDLPSTKPPEINPLQNYAAIVVSPTVFKLAVTVANALAGTAVNFGPTSGSGTYRLFRHYNRRDLVRLSGVNYVNILGRPLGTLPTGSSSLTATVGVLGSPITVVSHGYVLGTALVFSGANIPAELTPGRVYFVSEVVNVNNFRVSETYGGASLPSVSSSPGFTVQRAKQWHALEDDIYEIPNDYAEADLFDINYSTSFDVVTLVHPDYPPSELRRFGGTSWDFVPIVFGQTLPAPANVSGVAEFGQQLQLEEANDIVVNGNIATALRSNVPDAVVVGDVVYWSTAGTFEAVGTPGLQIPQDEFYTVGAITNAGLGVFWLRRVDTGLPLGLDGGANHTKIGTPTIRITSLASELSHAYGVTAVDDNGRETSLSAPVTIANNLDTSGSANVVSWNRVVGAARYRVYKEERGLFSFVGEVEDDGSSSYSFRHTIDVAPDGSRTAPRLDDDLSGTDYPGAVVDDDQRRLFAGSRAQPQHVWGTRIGTTSDLSFHIPLLDDDRLSFDVAANSAEEVRHLVAIDRTIVLTSETEYRIGSANDDALTPTSIIIRPQTYIGSSRVRPVVVNNNILFAADRGGHLYEMGFSDTVNGFITGDVSIRAPHLFDGYRITQLAYMKAPFPVVWTTSSSGKLLGFTYAPSEQVGGWHQHAIGDAVESVVTTTEGAIDDVVYVVVLRTINGVPRRTIECMTSFIPLSLNDAFYVDCGATYNGAATTTPSGFDHLDGEVIDVLADGVVYRGFTVAGGSVTLPVAASVVHGGLGYLSQIITLPLAYNDDSFGQGGSENVSIAWVRTVRSGPFEVAPVFDTEAPDDADFVPIDVSEFSSSMHTGVVRERLVAGWSEDGRVALRQRDPLPWSVVSLTLSFESGG